MGAGFDLAHKPHAKPKKLTIAENDVTKFEPLYVLP